MRVDQAMYGTIKNGHALRCASGDLELANELAQRLDLPDTEPQGADWSPVTSGFAVRNRYVISRTFSDPSVGRSGMVVTHALICDLDEIAAIDDLRPLLAHLITSFDAGRDAVESLDVTPTLGLPPTTVDLVDTARALVSRGSGPVVRIGSDGFEDLIVGLWGQLWPALRRRLYFRLSFSPKDVIEKPEPTIVCTPASLVGRWQQQRIVGRSSIERSRAAEMIDGMGAGIDLLKFGEGIGANLDDFKELHLLEQAYTMQSATPDKVGQLVSAARLIERLSPDPICGEAEKRILVERLVAALPSAQPSEVLTLRNFALQGFGKSGLVWQALELWFESNDYRPSHDSEMVAILSDALIGEDAIAPWKDAVKRGLGRSVLAAGSKIFSGFWRWAKSEVRVALPFIELVGRDQKGLESLEDAAPKELDAATAKLIMAFAAKQKLFRLHAIVASASMTPSEAAMAQSVAEPGADAGAMRLAMRRAKPQEILDAVASIPDGRILAIAGEIVAKDPTLLVKRDMSNVSNRSIWLTALKIDGAVWRGPEDPRKDFNKLLDEQVDGGSPSMELLHLLSASPLADLTAYPRRNEVWNNVPATIRDRMLAATKDTWFANAAAGKRSAAIEPELVQEILCDPRLEQLLTSFPSSTLSDGLYVIDELGDIGNTRFRQWVSTAARAISPLSALDADLLGRALANRRQRDIVEDLVSLYRAGRKDVKPVLSHCIDQVGALDCWFLGLSPVSVTQKWDAFIELAAELFPNGPDQDGLWERAGGRDADLRYQGTGKERWRGAIRDVQNGKVFHVSKLIQQMRSDFPGNSSLRLIASDSLFKNHNGRSRWPMEL
ncbi:effector-associated domain EAD1-containing protein [Stenotrophomonas geniculata]|uniref:GAP1-N1 domain-containing protein n=1 Tax=Stenotrophomonas geniculata TaxID=86188 RepID=UPI002E795B42|nr:effector-associated domain EAD1-containing protein [Stenotrophomonas geniculata]